MWVLLPAAVDPAAGAHRSWEAWAKSCCAAIRAQVLGEGVPSLLLSGRL